MANIESGSGLSLPLVDARIASDLADDIFRDPNFFAKEEVELRSNPELYRMLSEQAALLAPEDLALRQSIFRAGQMIVEVVERQLQTNAIEIWFESSTSPETA